MRALVLTAITVATLAIGVTGSAASASAKAKVRLVEASPLVLRGVGFVGVERVRLTVSLGDRTAVRKLRASRAGVFEASFELRYGRCGPSLAVTAVGSRGSRVSWELVPLDCPDRADS